LLARSNFTDEKGSFNMGRNARIALTPYKGHSMEDAIVISQSFADKLKSDAAYGHRIDFKNGLEGGKGKFKALFKDTYVKDQFDKMDDEGVIKIGETVMPGDPLILASRPRSFSSASVDLGSLARNIKKSRSNASVTWDHETPGKVIGVTKTRSGWKVDVTTESPANVGDKIIQRQGQKSIISEILPDEDMPRTEDGRPVEVLMNQLSLPSRVNAAGLYEILLGKIAEKTGQPVEVPSFLKKGENWPAYIRALLKKHGIKSEEKLFDPKEARWLDNPVTVGNGYMIKLHHEVDHKISHRGQGSYDQNEQPAKGGFDGGQAKRMSGLESIGLLSAGAYDFMRESSTLRGQKNDAFWREMRMGNDPKEPGVPFVFKKYLAALKGAGLKASPVDGNRKHLRLGFFTDKDLDEETPIEIQNGDVLDMNTLSPKKGGLFDEKLTQGNRWGKISLGTQLPNPAAEKAIRKLLGLTEKEYRAIISGEKTI
jgi:DNA-directed RNA polymerase subunit beta